MAKLPLHQRKLPHRPRRRHQQERKRKKKIRSPTAAATPAPATSAPPAQESADDEARSSPLVRKIAREHGVSLSQVSGTGLGGRITKQDIMAFIERPASASPAPASDA